MIPFSKVLPLCCLLALALGVCNASAVTLGDGKGSDFDHVSALQAFMDKVEGASEEQKKSLLLSKKDMLVSLDRNGTRLAAYLPIKDAKTVEEQGHCPGKITGFEEPRYVFLKIGREFRSYCLQVSPCQILEWDLPHLDNDTVGCVFNLEDQMKEVHEIFKDDLLNKLDSVLDRANLDAVPAYSTTTFSPRTDKVVPPSGRSFKGESIYKTTTKSFFSDDDEDFEEDFWSEEKRTTSTPKPETTTTQPPKPVASGKGPVPPSDEGVVSEARDDKRTQNESRFRLNPRGQESQQEYSDNPSSLDKQYDNVEDQDEDQQQAHMDAVVAYYIKSITALSIIFVLFVSLSILSCYCFYKRWQSDLIEVSSGRLIISNLLDLEGQSGRRRPTAAEEALPADKTPAEKSDDRFTSKLSSVPGAAPRGAAYPTYRKMSSPRLLLSTPTSQDKQKKLEALLVGDMEDKPFQDNSAVAAPVSTLSVPAGNSQGQNSVDRSQRAIREKSSPAALSTTVPAILPPPATPRTGANRRERPQAGTLML